MSREQEIYQYSRMEIDSNMTKEQFRERLAQGKMILDGATGSNLQGLMQCMHPLFPEIELS